MAAACGWLFLNLVLALGQAVGVLIIVGAVLSVNREAQRRSVRSIRTSMQWECCIPDNDPWAVQDLNLRPLACHAHISCSPPLSDVQIS
jgi:hypothetical protein